MTHLHKPPGGQAHTVGTFLELQGIASEKELDIWV